MTRSEGKLGPIGLDPAIRFAAGSAYELLVGIGAVHAEERRYPFEAARAWRAAAETKAPELLSTGSAWNEETWSALYGLTLDHGPDLSARELIQLVATMDPRDLRLRALGYYRRWVRSAVATDVIEDAASGDRDAIDKLRRRAFPGDPSWRTTIDYLEAEPPLATRDELAARLTGWYELILRDSEATLVATDDSERERWAKLAEAMTGAELIEDLTGGVVYIPDVGSRVSVLVPAALTQPVTQIIDHRDTTIMICPYATAESSLSATPSQRLMRMLKGLGDETRMRVLLLLRERPLTAKEVAAALGIPRTSIFHHMIVLRTAGLVRTTQPGFGPAIYSARDTALSEVSTLLADYLKVERARSAKAAKPRLENELAD